MPIKDLGLRLLFLVIFLFPFRWVFGHQPDFSSMMLFEQKDRTFLLIKSSLTAFEGVVDFHFKKNSYQTPEEFRALVLKDFQKNCILIANDDTLTLVHASVLLGHETTVVAEVQNMPTQLTRLEVKNTLFQDIPDSMCELILSLNGLPQKLYLFNKEKGREVTFRVENKKWVEETSGPFSKPLVFLFGGMLVLVIGFLVSKKRRPNQVASEKKPVTIPTP